MCISIKTYIEKEKRYQTNYPFDHKADKNAKPYQQRNVVSSIKNIIFYTGLLQKIYCFVTL